MKPQRPILRYHGGKWLLAPWVIDHFPSHQIYVEPFAGAASVLMRKVPSRVEVLNDINQRIVSAFQILRSSETAKKLERAIRLTPCSEVEYRLARERSQDPLEDARRLLILGQQAHGSTGSAGGKLSGWRRGVRAGGSNNADEWAGLHEHIMVWADRLRAVYLECDNAIKVIERWDGADVLFYVDPPYVPETRTTGLRGYCHELTVEQHVELANCLHNVQGMVVLSGYACPLYDEDLYPEWARMERDHLADSGAKRTEVLWINPAAWERLENERAQLSFALEGS